MAPSTIEKAVCSMYTSEDYSDLAIKCGAHVFKLHKAIVCPQSEFLRNSVVENRFIEGETGVIAMHGDSPEALRALKEFCYTGQYTTPGLITPSGGTLVKVASSLETILFNLKVYALADKTLTEELKELADRKFGVSLFGNENVEDIAIVSKHVFEVTVRGSRSSRIRGAVVDHAMRACLAPQLFKSGSAFKKAMDETPELGSDIAMALVREYHLDGSVVPMCCQTCHLTCTISKDHFNPKTVLDCPWYECDGGQLKVASEMRFKCRNDECGLVCETFVWPQMTNAWCPSCKSYDSRGKWRGVIR